MNILTRSSNDIPGLVKEHISLFDSFKCVYLFGSSLDPNKIHNDIDILAIYIKYSIKIGYELKKISDELGRASGLYVDLTALSTEEEKDTHFLEKIKPHYLKLK